MNETERKNSQNNKVYRYMKEFGEITPQDAMRFGCFRLAARISDLRKRGVEINRRMRDVTTADGGKARVAAYSIAE